MGSATSGNITHVTIWSRADLQEFWADIWMENIIVLWCDGLKEKPAEIVRHKKQKGMKQDENESDEDIDQTAKQSAAKKRKS